ncbi:MAG: NAD(P)-dependent oxidoreductase [Paracoccus sp. (in: a-proteobacteria)]|jgi:phosphoglycerate dehydrogenase-like enzyme
MIALIRRIRDVCMANSLRACLYCDTPGYAARAVGWGFDLTILGDVNSVAEHAMMHLLARARRALLAARAVPEPGGWDWRNRLEQREISGKNLLILGYGGIGRHLARMVTAFGMQVRAHVPAPTAR